MSEKIITKESTKKINDDLIFKSDYNSNSFTYEEINTRRIWGKEKIKKETRNEVQDFENLREATRLKDELTWKIEQLVKKFKESPWIPNSIKNKIDSLIFITNINNIFYKLENNKDKVNLIKTLNEALDNFPKNPWDINNLEKTLSTIKKQLENKLSKFDLSKDEIIKTAGYIAVLWVIIWWLGGLLAMGMPNIGLTIVIIGWIISFAWVGTMIWVDKIYKDKPISKNEIFDLINDYIPDISKSDFDRFYNVVNNLKISEDNKKQMLDNIIWILKEYKESWNIIDKNEFNQMISILTLGFPKINK